MRAHRKILLLSIGIATILLGPAYLGHLTWFFSTASQGRIIEGQWLVALVYMTAFVGMAYFLRPSKRRDEWKKRAGAYSVFFIALFTEMFGFPLTLYLLSIFTGEQANQAPSYIATNFSLFGNAYTLMWTTMIAMVFSLFCAVLVIYSWKKVFKSKKLVTDGPYSVIRHPQYTAIISMTLVWAISWPTLTTLLLVPLVIYLYYTLSLDEEKRMRKEFSEYEQYSKRVPMLVP